MLAQLDDNRTIRAVECDRLDLSPLVGARGGGHLRAALEEKIPDELAQGSPLYLVLDDISGASLVSGWAWSRWMGDDFEEDMKSGFEPTGNVPPEPSPVLREVIRPGQLSVPTGGV